MVTLYKNILNIFKDKYLLLIQTICTFLIPIKSLIFLIFLMIMLDTITGIWKAKKNKTFTSRGLFQAVSKMLLYQVALITFFILDKYLLGEFVSSFTSIHYFLTKSVAVFFCTVEIVSLNENIKEIYGLNFFQLLKKFIGRAKELKTDIQDLTK